MRAITGNIDDQADLVSLLGEVQGLYRPASANSFGMVKPDGQTVTIDNNTISAVVSLANEETVTLETPVVDLSLGNCFSYTCTADTTFSFINFNQNSFTSFKLYINDGGLFSIQWPSNVTWNDGLVAELSSEGGIDVVEFITIDNGVTWIGNTTISWASSTLVPKMRDTDGVYHKIFSIVDDETYNFDFLNYGVGRPEETIITDCLSFNSLESVVTDSFLYAAFNETEFTFKQLDFNSVSFPVLVSVGCNGLLSMFKGHSCELDYVNFPLLETIEDNGMDELFNNSDESADVTIQSVDLSSLKYVGSRGLGDAFNNCNVQQLSIENLEEVGESGLCGTFTGCQLSTITFPNLTTLSTGALENTFQNSPLLTSASFPALTTVPEIGFQSCFEGCENLSEIDFSNVTEIGDYGFNNACLNCTSLTFVDLSSLESVGSNGMSNAFSSTAISVINFPALTYIGENGMLNTFASCDVLQEVHFLSEMYEDETFRTEVEKCGAESSVIFWDL